MVARLNTTIALFGIILFTACKQACRVVLSTYENEKERVVLIYPDCNDTSYYKRQEFYDNGQIAYEGFYKKGEKVGHFKSWSISGHQTADWTILDGKEHGHITCWYDDGTKKRESTLNRGIKSGLIKEWYSNGKQASEGIYRNGKKIKSWKTWDENGTWRVRNYINDTLWGNTIEHLVDSTNTILVAGQYKAGKEVGVWKWFNKDSILYETSTYNKGELTGENMEYYQNGTVKSRGYLVNGKYNGPVYIFDSTGHSARKLLYKYGKLVTSK